MTTQPTNATTLKVTEVQTYANGSKLIRYENENGLSSYNYETKDGAKAFDNTTALMDCFAGHLLIQDEDTANVLIINEKTGDVCSVNEFWYCVHKYEQEGKKIAE